MSPEDKHGYSRVTENIEGSKAIGSAARRLNSHKYLRREVRATLITRRVCANLKYW